MSLFLLNEQYKWAVLMKKLRFGGPFIILL